jgi:hypothetical protein
VSTELDFKPNDSHFVTLEFTRVGVGAQLELRYWPIVKNGVTAPDFGKSIWKRTIK